MERNVLDLLERTANQYPEKISVVDGEMSLTFSALLQHSRAVGTALCPLTPQRGLVVVLCERQWTAIPGLLGALYSGSCYIPLDKTMPTARLHSILSQIHADVILYSKLDEKYTQGLSAFAPLLCIEDAIETAADAALLADRRSKQLDLDPAYVIFTSGSTGTPKGIAVSHRGILDFAHWLIDSCEISGQNILGMQAPFYFDTAQKSLMPMLTCGATMHILPKKLFSFPLLLTRYLNQNQVNTLLWSTAAFHLIANSGVLEKEPPQYVHTVAVGGEALMVPQLNRWRRALPEARFHNHYGPTEISVDCAFYQIDRDFSDDEKIPIGRACPNKEILLLDDALRPVPSGEIGELCVRGSGLALGYLDSPKKTEASFIQNPLNSRYRDLLYRTGDLARIGTDGNLYFVGRKDDQIKHMGYRIELGEVETAICAIPGVQAAACLFDKENDKIVCFCQSTSTVEALVTAAKQRIPKYMTPNVWRIEQRLPANANGKIDRVKLRERYFAEN